MSGKKSKSTKKTTGVVVDPVANAVALAQSVFEGHSQVIGLEVTVNAVIPNPNGEGLVKVEMGVYDVDPRKFAHKEGKPGPSTGFHVSAKFPDPTGGDGEAFQLGILATKVRSNQYL